MVPLAVSSAPLPLVNNGPALGSDTRRLTSSL